jgi:hypothetical protein
MQTLRFDSCSRAGNKSLPKRSFSVTQSLQISLCTPLRERHRLFNWHGCQLGLIQMHQISAQPALRSENNRFHRRHPAIQRSGNLGITHALVVAQYERTLVVVRQPVQLFPHVPLRFLAKHLRKRRRRARIRHRAQVISHDHRAPFTLPPPQFINAVAPCDLTNPGPQRMLRILLVEHQMQFQENLGRGIFRVLRPPKEASTDLQDVLVVSSINGAQNFRRSL